MTRRASKFQGFTLVEVMLTTVLAAVLLVALWSLLSMYSKAFEGGHARTEQSQLARALLEQISTDVQSVLIAPPADLPDGAGGAPPPPVSGAVLVNVSTTSPAAPAVNSPIGSAAVAASRPSHQASPSQSSPTPPTVGNVTASMSGTGALPSVHHGVATASLRPVGIYGTNSFLQLDVLQPAMLPFAIDDEELTAGDPEAPPRAEELRTIVYAFEEYRDPSNPSAAPETRLVRRELNWAQAHPAHAIGRGINETPPPTTAEAGEPRSPTESAVEPAFSADGSTGFATDASNPDEEQASVAEISVPEVLAFGVRYFDGSLWSEEWDSASRHGLPVAIEVSLRLRSADEPIDPAAAESQVQSGADLGMVEELKHPTRRLLIPVALAQRPATTAGPLGATPADGIRGPLETEAPRGLDSP